MSLYSYFQKQETHNCLPKNPPPGSTLTQLEIDKTNKLVKAVLDKQDEGDHTEQSKHGKYAIYTTVERARIGKYAAENGTTRACKHFSQLWKRDVPEATVRHLKNEYLKQLSQQKHTGMLVESLSTKQKGRPLLVGIELDKAIQDYILYNRCI